MGASPRTRAHAAAAAESRRDPTSNVPEGGARASEPFLVGVIYGGAMKLTAAEVARFANLGTAKEMIGCVRLP